MKCANCGNTDKSTLFDEGDTIFCSKCSHRTRISDCQDDLVECPYCHRLRDRKAMYCLWCNNAWGNESDGDPTSVKEYDKILSDFDKDLDSSNIRYWKIRKYK